MANGEGTPPDEEMRKLLKPNPTEEQVDQLLSLLERTYLPNNQTLNVLKVLESYDDKNYLVQATDDTMYVIKCHNGVESQDFFENGNDSSIRYQNSLMEHLNEHGVTTSTPLHDFNGDTATRASLNVVSERHCPQDLVVRMLTFVPGRPMCSLPSLPIESLLNAGQFLGTLDAKLDLVDSTKYKASQRYHAWDGKNTLDVRKYTHCIDGEQRRDMVESILDAFKHDIIDKDVDFRTGVLQADFNDANILVDQDLQVSGVIDFGDSICSWRVLEISVAMAYSMLSSYGKRSRSIGAASAMLRGYNSVYPLQDVERQHLYLLIACRLACSATLGAYSYKQNPENVYLLLHAEPAWRALELLWGNDVERRVATKAAVERMFDKACSFTQPDMDAEMDCSDLSLPDPDIVDLLSSVRDENGTTRVPDVKRQKTETSDAKPSITFVTGNKKKLEEVKRILCVDGNAALPFAITSRKVDLPELQGNPIEIAKEKCSDAAREVGGAVITEDTSLCFAALDGLPGPYIKWFLESCGHAGLINIIAFSDDKSAYAQTVVAFCPGPEKDVVVFDGRTMGKIVQARGSLDFGWDPIFEPDEGGGLTYAEMSKEGKDAISHRSRAFSQLRSYLTDNTAAIMSSLVL